LNTPNPALVTERAARRLPRVALWLFCAAYLLPGLFGRDPWKSADITAFGYMVNIAQGHTHWLSPMVGGLPADAAVLPYWVGALSIKLLGAVMAPELAARIPFALLLGVTLLLTWYSTYHLARTDAAQPLPFAFGGEASPVNYARAIADGALLAVMACLGLLQLGHETTPELVQLASVSLLLYSLAASPFRPWQSRISVLVALPALAASGAPSIAMLLGASGVAACWRSSHPGARSFVTWLMAAVVIAAGVATSLGAWGWRLDHYDYASEAFSVARLFAWFTWPAWPLALWTLWRWRDHLLHRHIAIPLGCTLVSMLASIAMGGSDRALMLALPPLAVLAAFALPTLHRGTSAAIDWFSVFFFSAFALAIWVVYVSVQTGLPAKPAANVAKLAPGFVPSFSLLALLLAVAATLAWLWLVHWRTGRHRHPLWKSMVLPASGVALCWLLLMTLGLPLFDYARSYRPLINRVVQYVPRDACIAAPGLSRAQLVALEFFGDYRVDGSTTETSTSCEFLLRAETPRRRAKVGSGWLLVARELRPSDSDEVFAIYRRVDGDFPDKPTQ
jgi:4-amino-4-deoxy-L-arabinose transferase-like glycosyltransferase